VSGVDDVVRDGKFCHTRIEYVLLCDRRGRVPNFYYVVPALWRG